MKQEIYQPAEDSYLLSGTLKNYLKNIKDKNIKILDMGTGSGIQAITCKNLGFKDILAIDINKEAVKFLKKQNIKAVHSNLFSKIQKNDKYDLIIFNPSYLPEDKYDKQVDTTAGKQGYELIIKFLKEAKSHIKNKVVILLLFSSLSKPNIIKKQAKELGYELKLLKKQNIFFEELYVYELTRRSKKFPEKSPTSA